MINHRSNIGVYDNMLTKGCISRLSLRTLEQLDFCRQRNHSANKGKLSPIIDKRATTSLCGEERSCGRIRDDLILSTRSLVNRQQYGGEDIDTHTPTKTTESDEHKLEDKKGQIRDNCAPNV